MTQKPSIELLFCKGILLQLKKQDSKSSCETRPTRFTQKRHLATGRTVAQHT